MSQFISSIGIMYTPFREKFGTPRQSNLVPAAKGVIKLNADQNFLAAVNGLEEFSHLWIVFLFDRHLEQPWRAKITPPRTELGRIGVFASRSPHRPNPIGISAVKLEHIDRGAAGGIEIHCSGVDLLDSTPVIDIKPYIPYSDAIPGARAAWAEEPGRFQVKFSPHAEERVTGNPGYRSLLEQTLALDPRPRSQKESMPLLDRANEGKIFRFRLADHDVEWQIRNGEIYVLDLFPLG